ncbi:MAG: SHOCT domain-containing protein [Chloroflexi bacterium]|nr:SHOCT domain-containing protein [Chloroflexota bacterium]
MGLIKTALKTAVAVKTAHVVHDRIQSRQGEQQAAMPTPAGAPSAPAAVDDTLARLSQLGELRAAGVLTEAEFEAQKARVLSGG